MADNKRIDNNSVSNSHTINEMNDKNKQQLKENTNELIEDEENETITMLDVLKEEEELEDNAFAGNLCLKYVFGSYLTHSFSPLSVGRVRRQTLHLFTGLSNTFSLNI
jgi:rubrerythrin